MPRYSLIALVMSLIAIAVVAKSIHYDCSKELLVRSRSKTEER